MVKRCFLLGFFCFCLSTLSVAQPTTDPKYMSELMQLFRSGKKQEAIDRVDRDIDLSFEDQNWQALLWLYSCKANLYMFPFVQDSVVAVYEDAMLRVSPDDNKNFHLQMLLARTEAFQLNTQWNESLAGWRKAYLLTEPSSPERSQVLQRLAECLHYLQADPDSVRIFTNESERIARELGDSMRIASVLDWRAIYSKNQGNYQTAIKYLIEGLAHVRQEKQFTIKRVSILNQIGSLFSEIEDYDRAEEYGLRALELAQKNGYKRSVATINDFLGRNALHRGDVDKALIYLRPSLAYFSRGRDVNRKVEATLSIIDAFINQNQLDSARYYLDQIQSLIPEVTAHSQAKYHVFTGRIAFMTRSFAEAKSDLLQAKEFTDDRKFPKLQLMVLDGLKKTYRGEGDFRSALVIDDQMELIQDSLYHTRTQQFVQDNEARYKKVEQDQEIGRLASQNAIKDIQLNARNRQLLIGGIGLLGFVLLSGWIYALFRQKKQANALLAEKNEVIRDALKEKDALLREIHHRVKNNLQTISSLLSLQSKSVEDAVAVSALQEGRNRVKSMALIHQNLYQDETLIGIDIKSYMEKLANSLFSTYAIEEDKVRFTTDIDPIKLDVEQVIPLGLIINELISNALKYAFQNRRQGEIKLAIKKQGGALFVRVEDDGVGLPNDFNISESKSLGFKLIRIFSQKLKAKFEVDGNAGTTVTLKIPLDKAS